MKSIGFIVLLAATLAAPVHGDWGQGDAMLGGAAGAARGGVLVTHDDRWGEYHVPPPAYYRPPPVYREPPPHLRYAPPPESPHFRRHHRHHHHGPDHGYYAPRPSYEYYRDDVRRW